MKTDIYINRRSDYFEDKPNDGRGKPHVRGSRKARKGTPDICCRYSCPGGVGALIPFLGVAIPYAEEEVGWGKGT